MLNIGGTYVTNLKPLEGKTSLIDLSIVNTSIKNVEYVLTLTSLRYFKAYKTKIKKKNIDLLNEIRPDLNVTYY